MTRLAVIAIFGIQLFAQGDCDMLGAYLQAWSTDQTNGLVDHLSDNWIDVRDIAAHRNRCDAPCTGPGIPMVPYDLASTEFARFLSWVDQAVAGSPGYNFSATDAMIAYQATGVQAYVDLAIEMTDDFVSSEEALIGSAMRPTVAYDSYLYIGEIIGDLATTYDWAFDQLTVTQRNRWSAYAEQAIWNVWNYDNAQWGGNPFPWSGWSINNPGNNYYYSFVEATMLWGLASQNATWLDFLCTDKLPALATYFTQIPGGGSQEGTGYGTSHARLFRIYRIWRDATGQDLSNFSTHTINSMEYWLHAVVPTLDYFAPLGDQARVSTAPLYDYQRNLVLRALDLNAGTLQAGHAAWWLNRISIFQMTSGFNFKHELQAVTEPEMAPTDLVYFSEGTGHLFARSDWTTQATWISVSAGPYRESHDHPDQGAFSIYKDSWQAVAQNIHTHSGIFQDVTGHNVLRFQQGATVLSPGYDTYGTQTHSWDSGDLVVQANLTPSFVNHPDILSWNRVVRFNQTLVKVTDATSVQNGVTVNWQLNTPAQPVIVGNEIHAGALRIVPIVPAAPTIQILDWTTVDPSEHLSGYRIELGGSTQYEVDIHIDLP